MPTGKQPCPWCPAVLVPEYFERHVAAHRLFLADCARREMPPGVAGDEEESLPPVLEAGRVFTGAATGCACT